MKQRSLQPQIQNLYALQQATQFIDQILAQQPDDFVNIQDYPVLQSTTLKLHEILNEVDQGEPEAKSADLTNVKLIAQLIDQVMNERINFDYSRAEIFNRPVSLQVAPNYYNLVHFPMCFSFIKLRLYMNQLQQRDIQVSEFQYKNLILNVQPGNYGSIMEQKFDFDTVQSDFARKAVKMLKTKPKPYKNLDEVISDLLLITCNCCFFNAQDVNGMCKQGHALKDSIIEAFQKQFKVEVPEWINSCCDIQNLKIMMEKHKEIKNEWREEEESE
ncbi:Conserved_hypothetical protein [Hexamita inflata]|uniref:Bromo domain-containing protein n=1 Tax=Hexamita inflata TaxID=28002 RepID=A0AA86QNN9_9EUKA|nr:Conserved hypothetical protein [Hexamita inflata]